MQLGSRPEVANPSITIDVSISKTFPVDLQNYYFFKYRKKNIEHFLKCLLKWFLTDFASSSDLVDHDRRVDLEDLPCRSPKLLFFLNTEKKKKNIEHFLKCLPKCFLTVFGRPTSEKISA